MEIVDTVGRTTCTCDSGSDFGSDFGDDADDADDANDADRAGDIGEIGKIGKIGVERHGSVGGEPHGYFGGNGARVGEHWQRNVLCFRRASLSYAAKLVQADRQL